MHKGREMNDGPVVEKMTVIIPAYNEQETIAVVIDDLWAE